MSNTIYPSNEEIIKIVSEHPFHYYRIIKRECPELFEHLSTLKGDTHGERLYNYVYSPTPTCKHCGGDNIKFNEFTTGYRQFCSQKCASFGTRDKSRETCMRKYGVDSPSKFKELADSRSRTMFERFGGTSPMADITIRNKASRNLKATLAEKFPSEINGRSRSQYNAACRYYTNKIYKAYREILDPEGKRSFWWVLDHKYSINDGFKNNVPIDVICHPSNLELIHKSDNSSKNCKSNRTLEELYESYKKGAI